MTFLRTFRPRGLAFIALRRWPTRKGPMGWAILTEWATDYSTGERIERFSSKLRALAVLAWRLFWNRYGVGQTSIPNPRRYRKPGNGLRIDRRTSPHRRPYRSPYD